MRFWPQKPYNEKGQLMSDFARLETHDGLQVLAFIEAKDQGENGEYGPCLIRRCDPSISVTTTLGPWSDDDEGWDAAEAALRNMDMAEYAKLATDLVANFQSQQ